MFTYEIHGRNTNRGRERGGEGWRVPSKAREDSHNEGRRAAARGGTTRREAPRWQNEGRQ